MSQMIDFTLPSCQPGRTLHAFRCVPEGEVRAVLRANDADASISTGRLRPVTAFERRLP